MENVNEFIHPSARILTDDKKKELNTNYSHDTE
jgi:hypothetical protein